MNELKKVLELATTDLQMRRDQLEEELQNTVRELIYAKLKPTLVNLFKEYKVENAAKVSWEFYPESDDEGGTTWCFTGLTLTSDDGEDLDLDDYVVNKKSKYSDSHYDYELGDELQDTMYDFKDDLYELSIEELYLD